MTGLHHQLPGEAFPIPTAAAGSKVQMRASVNAVPRLVIAIRESEQRRNTFDTGDGLVQILPVAAQMAAMRSDNCTDFADRARTGFRARFSMVGRHWGTFGFAGSARSAGLSARCRSATPSDSGWSSPEQRTLTMKHPASRNAPTRVHHIHTPRSFTIRAGGLIRRAHGANHTPPPDPHRLLIASMLITASAGERQSIAAAVNMLDGYQQSPDAMRAAEILKSVESIHEIARQISARERIAA